MEAQKSLNELTPDATLSQIVCADQQASNLLASIGLDPSGHKDETLRSVCRQRKWSETEVMQWLKEHQSSANGEARREARAVDEDFGEDLVQWSHYLEESFHRPNQKLLQEISDGFPRVKKIHGNQYPWIKNIEHRTNQFVEDFRLYLTFLTDKFYPLVRKIDSNNKKLLNGTVRETKRAVEIITDDQHRLEELMNTIRDKGNNFENPEGGCTSLRILNHQFKELHDNLMKQFELEQEYILPLVRDKLKAIH